MVLATTGLPDLDTGEDPATSTELAPSRRTICHGDGGFSCILLPTRRPGAS